jgi:hypothetical protein
MSQMLYLSEQKCIGLKRCEIFVKRLYHLIHHISQCIYVSIYYVQKLCSSLNIIRVFNEGTLAGKTSKTDEKEQKYAEIPGAQTGRKQ